MTTYQSALTDIIDASRKSNGTSLFSGWVRQNYYGKFIVSVRPIDSNGNFSVDPLKNRGYEFSGAGTDQIDRGLLVGKKCWFRAFDTLEEAEAEEIAITETGI